MVMQLRRLTCGLVRLESRDLGVAFLVACISWVAITLAWSRATPGGNADKIINSLLSPPYRVGKHLGHVFFPNYSSRNTLGFYFAPLFGVAVELSCLMALWIVAVSCRRWFRVRKGARNSAAL